MTSLVQRPDALNSDKLLCQLVSGQHIAEDIGANIPIQDPSTSFVSIDSKLQYIVAGLDQEIERWKAQIPPELLVREYNHEMPHFGQNN
jgi:hypothetical protein